MKSFLILTVLLGICLYPNCVKSQNGIPDSVLNVMWQIDSVESILDNLDTSLNTVGIINPYPFINGSNINAANYKRCRSYYEISYSQDKDLCGTGKMIEVFYDGFETFKDFFWRKVDLCEDGCAMSDPSSDKDCINQSNDLDDGMETMRQWFTANNVRTEDGMLKIDTKYEPDNLQNKSWFNTATGTTTQRDFLYSSGYLMSKFMFPFEYGKIEARIKLPYIRQGIQPAFWMYSGVTEKNPAINGYPEWNELDIFEFRDNESLMKTTMFKQNSETFCQSYYNKSRTFFDDWHIYTCYWSPVGVAIYIDDNLAYVRSQYTKLLKSNLCEIKKDEVVRKKKIYPDKPLDIRFNNYVYVCDDHKPFPYEFPREINVDWVRVSYKKKCDANILIDDLVELPHDTRVYNFLVGDNVEIDVDYSIPSNEMLKVIHSSDLLLTNLEVSSDGLFLDEIKPDLCNGQSVEELVNTPKTTEKFQIIPDLVNFEIFPNPVLGEIRILRTGFNEFSQFDFILQDINGNVVYNNKLNDSKQTIMNVSSIPEGCYFYSISSNKDRTVKRGKLLLCVQN